MSAGDMLEAHNDVNQQRRLAFIFYFSRNWNRSFGGSLVVTGLDGSITTIVPTFNSLVIFEVTAHRSHRVETIAEAAGQSRRLSISGWFDHPAEGA
jgi:Rps23 Pro-64 3,4-dihydroxylase Tpa1-like proline 4-hydroxylase